MNRDGIRSIATSLTLMLLTVAAAQAGGYYYEALTTTQSDNKRLNDEMKVHAWIDGPKAKIEFATGQKGGFFTPGSYLLTQDAGETVYLVNPEDRTYASFDLDKMLSAAGQVMNMMNETGGVMKLEFTDITSEKLLEEGGGTLLGHDTTHYRYKTGYTMQMAVMGFKQQNRTEMLQDVWSTDDYDAAGFSVWLRPDRRFKTGHEGLDELMNTEWSKISGFPLKTVMVSTTTNKKGKTMQQTSTTEVTTLREETIADTTFELPAGYTETQIVPELPQGEAEQQAEEEPNEKRGLRGLFKKPDG